MKMMFLQTELLRTLLLFLYIFCFLSLDQVMISESPIEDIISNLDIYKAVGSDLISHIAIKNVKSSICEPLCMLFNKSA